MQISINVASCSVGWGPHVAGINTMLPDFAHIWVAGPVGAKLAPDTATLRADSTKSCVIPTESGPNSAKLGPD